MIKVSVMYPNTADIKFDIEYYKNTHLPMITAALGDALKGMEFVLGIGGRVPGEKAPYFAIVDLKFESVAAFQASFGPHAATFAADVPNYTNAQGELQISELV